jgi:alcohol dehydrogenase class IV
MIDFVNLFKRNGIDIIICAGGVSFLDLKESLKELSLTRNSLKWFCRNSSIDIYKGIVSIFGKYIQITK